MSEKTVSFTPEFSREIEVARVPKLGSHEKISADAAECKALAKRLGVPMVHGLQAHLQVKPWRGGGVKVWGNATLDVTRESVISLEEFRTTQVFAIERYFLNVKADDDSGEMDIDPIDEGRIDMGECVAEAIALDLEPYPRKPGEQFASAVPEGDPIEPEKPNPFNVLKMLTPER
jgi:uncharacterized metal-binding protein YceD (DUF177 family)